MNVFLCGNIIPEQISLNISKDSPATNKYLKYLLDGFKENGCNVNYISYIAYKNAKQFFDAKKDLYEKSSFIFKDKLIIPSVLKYQQRVLKFTKKGDIVLFYNATYCYWGLQRKLEKKGVHCILIIADHDSIEDKKNIIRRQMILREESEIKRFKRVVLLSSLSKSFISASARFIIMEGGIKFSDFENITPINVDNETITLLYAGTLAYVTGINLLLDAFMKNTNPRLKLVISGKGPLESVVKEASERDHRIEYKGFVSVSEYLILVQTSTILINPRNMAMKENQYNFPSKILEYLAIGRPIISTMFPGYERFKDYIFFYNGEENELNSLVNNLIDKPVSFYEKTFLQNKEFAKTFDWKNQTKRILDMISE